MYRIDGPGKVERVIAHEVDRPNGILVSAGDKYLYVADNVNDGPRGQGGNRKLFLSSRSTWNKAFSACSIRTRRSGPYTAI